MMACEGVIASLSRGSAGAYIAVIESMMGLYEGSALDVDMGFTARVADIERPPILSALDVSAIVRSAAAFALGITGYDPAVFPAGSGWYRVGRKALGVVASDQPLPPRVGGLPRRFEDGFTKRRPASVPAHTDTMSETVSALWAEAADRFWGLERAFGRHLELLGGSRDA